MVEEEEGDGQAVGVGAVRQDDKLLARSENEPIERQDSRGGAFYKRPLSIPCREDTALRRHFTLFATR